MVKLFLSMVCIVLLSCCGAKKKAVRPTTEINAAPTTSVTKPGDKTIEAEGITTTVRIIRVSCASLVAIITDDAMASHGEQWAPYNVRMAKPYSGSFTFINQNEFPKIKEGFEFKAKLLTAEQAPKVTEVRCMMEDYPPAMKYYVKALTEPKEQL